jgi:hypothetical protein
MELPEWSRVTVISGRTARYLLDASNGPAEVTLDLGLTRATVEVEDDMLCLPEGEHVSRSALEELFNQEEDCIALLGDTWRKVYLYSDETNCYYKLYQPFADQAPTIFINNASMHSIVEKGPWQDEVDKVKVLPPIGGRCLDTCCGLGYSAQLLSRKGFDEVVSCEIDREVLRVASINPWSRSLFHNSVVQIVEIDVRDYVDDLPEGSFEAIFHDPPTVYQAGALYGEELYREFWRVLTNGGVLYHYVGEPGRKRGQDYAHGVIQRLQEAGFRNVKRATSGVVAKCRK